MTVSFTAYLILSRLPALEAFRWRAARLESCDTMDQLEFVSCDRRWIADLTCPLDLAIALKFDGPQPRFFAQAPARAVPLQAGRFTGDVGSGASCNCGLYTLAPHCHGTHTECAGHLTSDAMHLTAVTPVAPVLALLISVAPRALGDVREGRPAVCDPSDPVITREALAAAAARWTPLPWTALVVRTLPNDPGKRHRQYDGPCAAPYFTLDAIGWMVERDVTSLVVDLPSLDRADDGGALAAHRAYWGLQSGAVQAQFARRPGALVTELAYAPDDVADGLYLLDLQVPAFAADAAPSRPVLYRLTEVAVP